MVKKPRTDWSPGNTLVLVLGLGLDEWADEDNPGWRRHATIAQIFRDAGVPDDQLLFWEDRDGHPDTFRKKLPKFLENSDEDTLFIFYYAGHGYAEEGDDFYFCHPATDDAISKTELFDIIEASFEGYRVLLTADCCYSGALAREVATRETEYHYAALTSSTGDIMSTGNWTFSDCLIAALRGEGGIDADHDGTISFKELADHVVRQMRDVEEQPADFETNEGFDSSFRLALVKRR